MRLTPLGIGALPVPEKQKTHFDDSLPGFGVRVSPGGTKTFVLMVGRERKLHSIGRYPATSLKTARSEALRLLAEHSTNPNIKPRMRVSDAIESFLREKEAQTRYQTMRQYRRILNVYFKHIHGRYLEDINTDDITAVTDKLLKQGKLASANITSVNIKTFFKWCVRRRLIKHSPAEGLDRPAREVSRDRVLTDQELKLVWRAAKDLGSDFGTIVQLLALTGQRRLEIGSLKAEWIQCDQITLPAAICKNKQQHSFPIGALTASLARPFFQNNWSKQKADLDKLAQIAPWRIHDLRRTYCTNLQRLGVRLEVIEALVNHISGTRSGVAGIYQRHRYEAEMREAVTTFEEWFTKVIVAE